GDRVVGARNAHQLRELVLERGMLLAQNLDLTLHQRDGGAAARVRHAQAGEQRLVALEEIGIVLQVRGDRVFLVFLGGQPSGFSCRHCQTSTWPAKETSAGPVSQMFSPGPFQFTRNSPPRTLTCTSRSSLPQCRPTATAAQAPVPQARVSPTPRSYTRKRICERSMLCMNPAFTRLGKRGCRSIAGPS